MNGNYDPPIRYCANILLITSHLSSPLTHSHTQSCSTAGTAVNTAGACQTFPGKEKLRHQCCFIMVRSKTSDEATRTLYGLSSADKIHQKYT